MTLAPCLALLGLAAQQPADSLLPPAPAGWRHERLAFPLDFAPELELAGFEDLLFAPGMFAPDSESYFSYALALRLEGDVEVDAEFLERFLTTYYRGLCRAVGAGRGLELQLDSVAARVEPDGPRFHASVQTFDAFVTGEALELELDIMAHATPRATEVIGLASPLGHDAPIWQELGALGAAWRAARPAALFLNHLYRVVDRETFAALEGCAFLRETLAVSERRDTVRADTSYAGLYFYGARTYFEFLPPDAQPGLGVGSTGLGFGLELPGATDALQRSLAAAAVRSQAFPITRQLDAVPVPWFRMLAIEPAEEASPLGLFALEYDPLFLARWHADLPPGHASIRRRDVLERYAASLDLAERRASAPFGDVAEVELALDVAQREQLLALCRAAGYEIEAGPESWTCRGPEFRLRLRPADSPGGITRFDLSLRQPLEHDPLELGQVRVTFQDRTASFRFRD